MSTSPNSYQNGPRIRPVPAVTRSIAILRLLGSGVEPMGVQSVAQSLSLVPSTCLHILRVLVEERLVKVDPSSKRYSLGVGMLLLARNVIERTTFASLAQPVLDRVSAQWGVTVLGVAIDRLEPMVVLAMSRSQMPFSLHVDVGSRFPALISATGRLVAAFSGLPWKTLESEFRRLRWQHAPDMAAWRKEIDAARRRGYSVDRGNYIAGIVIVAVPVLGTGNSLTHTLVAAGMAERLDQRSSVALAEDLTVEARRIAGLPIAKGDRR